MRLQFALFLLGAAMGCRGGSVDPVPSEVGDLGLAYSPGGDSLLVVFATESTASELVVVDRASGTRTFLGVNGAFPSWVAGRQDILITMGGSSARLRLSGPSVEVLPVPGLSPFATWHPTAPLIAITTNHGVNTNPPDLWLTDSSGGQQRRIPLAGPPRNQVDAASWSPDGNHVVASVLGRLMVFDTAVTDTAYITPESARAYHPAWSPAGGWIAYHGVASATRTGGNVYLVHPDGTGRHLLYTNGRYPKWSPDGARVGFIRSVNGLFAVWSVDTLGHDLQQESFPPNAP
jgi:hypothetical protein